MSEPTNDPTLIQAALAVLGALWGMITWQFKRLVGRVDEIEKHHVSRDEFNQTVNAIRQDIRSGNRNTSERLDHITQLIVQTRKD